MALLESSSDVAVLWGEALDDYTKVSEVNIRGILSSGKNLADIRRDQEQQLDNFKKFRHNKGKVDKLRSIMSDNANYIQDAANLVANAASTAFPPAATILTAFTYLMTASKNVSEDYDVIESFFDLMQSFLRRLSLLEGKIPPRKEFQYDLVKVFSSILAIAGHAHRYRLKGRFVAWGSALVKGNDSKLQETYRDLNENLKRLESATMIQTLSTAIDTYSEAKAISKSLSSVQESVDNSTTIIQASWGLAQSTSYGVNMLVKRSQESASATMEILRFARAHANESLQQERLKSSNSKPANLERFKQLSGRNERMMQWLEDMEEARVPGTFEWIEKDPAVVNIINRTERFLWVGGDSGMGKPSIAYKMFRHLEDTFSSDPLVCVACYSFDRDYSVEGAMQRFLIWCSVKAAEIDDEYCEETLRDMRSLPPTFKGSVDDFWQLLLESKYPSGSQRRLILVLDGTEGTVSEDFTKLLELFKKIQTQDCEIQIVSTIDHSRESSLPSDLGQRVNLTRDKIAEDMRHFAFYQIQHLPRLQTLGFKFRRSIARKVAAKADSFLYVLHITQRLDGIAYQRAIRKQLETLPANTTVIYETLLKDCVENRSLGDQEVLRSILAWLAYAKRDLAFGEAVMIIDVLQKESKFNMDEVLNGPLARLLCLSGNDDENADDAASQDSEVDEPDPENSQGATRAHEDPDGFLSFQDRPLREYFRQAINVPLGLRCMANQAQVIIFRIVSAILTLESKDGAWVMLFRPEKCDSLAQATLTQYASRWWLAHLLEIEVEKVSDDLAIGVLESLYNILHNKNSLKRLELATGGSSTILSAQGAEETKVLAALGSWARRSLELPTASLAHGIVEWFRLFAGPGEECRVFIPIARAHVCDWFCAEDNLTAYMAFISAHRALFRKDLVELQKNQTFCDYFDDFQSHGQQITPRSFEVILTAFEDIKMTPWSYLGVAMAMCYRKLYQEAVKQVDIGMGLEGIKEAEQFQLLRCKGETLFDLSQLCIDEEETSAYLSTSLHALGTAIEQHHEMVKTGTATSDYYATIVYTFMVHARVAARLGNYDLVESSTKCALKSGFWVIDSEELDDIVSTFAKAGEPKNAINFLKIFSAADMMTYLSQSANPLLMQEAAKRSNEEIWLLGLYATSIKKLALDPEPDGKNIYQLDAALFARQVMGDFAKAKELLRKVVDDPQSRFSHVEVACHWLVELLFEEFRMSGDRGTKVAALTEAKKLQRKQAEELGSDHEAGEIPTTVLLALMLRRLGPGSELNDVLQTAFKSCVDSLTDNVGFNDLPSFRYLARVLSCVEGLKKEAEVALTAQLYILDRAIYEKELAERKMSQENDAGRLEAEQQASSGESEDKGPKPAETPAIKADENEPATPANEMDAGLCAEIWISCSSCLKHIKDWGHGGAYLCVQCINCDICEECFKKREAREKGELEADWRIICPRGHRHIKAPVEGWRGVKDGILRIGNEEIPFREWLDGLEKKWDAYWVRYWSELD